MRSAALRSYRCARGFSSGDSRPSFLPPCSRPYPAPRLFVS